MHIMYNHTQTHMDKPTYVSLTKQKKSLWNSLVITATAQGTIIPVPGPSNNRQSTSTLFIKIMIILRY